LIGSAVFAAALVFAASAQVSPAVAAGTLAKKTQAGASDVSARSHYHHDRYRYAYRSYYPYYYGRPVYYAPAPFLPIPPFFGYGWEWW
jgi:hypothetical protein